MPDRIVRDELLESARFLKAPVTNTHRMCFLACLLRCDTLGNLEGTDTRLWRLWRDFGVDADQAIESTLAVLVEVDLVRTYEADGKRYLHIPRFRQSRRYLKRVHPLAPWNTDEEKQAVAKNSHGAHAARTPSAHVHTLLAPAGVGVGVGVLDGVGVGLGSPVDNSGPNSLAAILKSKPVETSGKAKGNGKGNGQTAHQIAIFGLAQELDMKPGDNEVFTEFEGRVVQEAKARGYSAT